MPEQETGTEARILWLHTRKTLNAVNALMSLYTLPTTLSHHSPTSMHAIRRAVLAQLAACRYLEGKDESRTGRDLARLALGCLKNLGEVWALSARFEKEIRGIARHVFGLSKIYPSASLPAATAAASLETLGGGQGLSQDPGQDSAALAQNRGIYDEFADLEYFEFLNSMSQQSMNQGTM